MTFKKFTWEIVKAVVISVIGILMYIFLTSIEREAQETACAAAEIRATDLARENIALKEQLAKERMLDPNDVEASVVDDTQLKTDAREIVEHIHKGKKPRVTLFYNWSMSGSFQIVFVRGRTRYTVWYSGGDAKHPESKTLSFWLRPNKTWDQASITTFSDEGLEGRVDFGIHGRESGHDIQKEEFWSSRTRYGEPKGLEFEAAWQKRYDATTKVVLAALK